MKCWTTSTKDEFNIKHAITNLIILVESMIFISF